MTGRDSSSLPRSLPPFVGLSVLIGCSAILLTPRMLPSAAILGLLALTALTFMTVRLRWRGQQLADALWPLCLAAAMTAWVVNAELESRWPASLAGERVVGELSIDSLIEGRGEIIEFDATLRIESPDTWARSLRVQGLWRHPPRPLPEAGETWRVLLRLTPPPQSRNPGGFDGARQALSDRLHARAQVLPWRATKKRSDASPGLLRLRAAISQRIQDRIIDRDAAALFAGLAVGATESVSVEQWRVFSVTGTTHLVAISGMHVTLFAWVMAGFARRVWGLSGRLMQRIDREVFAGVLGVMAAFAYALLAGFEVPTQRTVVMLAVWWAMRLSGRAQSDYAVLGLALVAVWLIDPLAPLSAGFWLSFVAMATLMSTSTSTSTSTSISTSAVAASGDRLRRTLWQPVLELMRVQWRIGLALLPLTVAWFSTVSIAGLFVNLLAIPIFSFVLVPLVLLGTALEWLVAPVAQPCWWLAELVHTLIWPPMHAIAQSEMASSSMVAPPMVLLLAGSTVAIWLFLPQNLWRRVLLGLLGVLLAIALWVSFALTPSVPAGSLRVLVLDSGDATAVILQTRTQTLVYDTGEQFGAPGSGARTRVIPALRERGVRSVDLLVLGSVNTLRIAGAATLATLLPVKEIRFGAGWSSPPAGARRCDRPLRWQRDGVEFLLLPAGEAQSFCLLRAGPVGGPKLLLAERLDRAAARALARESPEWLAADVVLAPRRGSVRMLDADFKRATGARHVLVSARLWSASSAQSVAQAWGLDQANVHSTATAGALGLELAAGAPVVISAQGSEQRAGVWRAASD